MSIRCALPILCAALAAPVVHAQVLQVFPGTPTRLQEVVDAAPAGAVLLVYPGDYRGLSIDKPLRIVATPHPFKRVRILPRLDAAAMGVLVAPLQVQGLEAGAALVLAGLDFADDPAAAAATGERALARLSDNLGRLQFVDCRFTKGLATEDGRPAVAIDDCAAAVFEACAFSGGAGAAAFAADEAHQALQVEGARVTLLDCLLEANQPAGAGLAPALTARQAELELARCSLVGGAGAAALALHGGSARLIGSPGAALRGGAAVAGLWPAGPALAADQGAQLRLHADVLTAPGASAEGEEPTDALQLAPDVAFELVPYRAPAVDFVDSTVVAGAEVQFQLLGEPGALLLLGIAFDAQAPLALPGIAGRLWLPPLTTGYFPVVQAVGEQPLTIAASLPANAPIGRQITAQALQFGAGLPLELSAPSALIVLP